MFQVNQTTDISLTNGIYIYEKIAFFSNKNIMIYSWCRFIDFSRIPLEWYIHEIMVEFSFHGSEI